MIKVFVDIILFLLLALEFSKMQLGSFIHELIGILIVVVLIVHLYLNRNYIKTIFKGKYNTSRIVLLSVNVLMFICLITSIVIGILISQSIFYKISSYNATLSKIHFITSYLTLILVSVHLGLNLNQMFIKMKIFKNKYVSYPLGIIIILYGIYSIIEVNFFKHLIGTRVLSNTYILINIMRYISIMLCISIITYNVNNIIKKIKK